VKGDWMVISFINIYGSGGYNGFFLLRSEKDGGD
jgi:hypothetical protein